MGLGKTLGWVLVRHEGDFGNLAGLHAKVLKVDYVRYQSEHCKNPQILCKNFNASFFLTLVRKILTFVRKILTISHPVE